MYRAIAKKLYQYAQNNRDKEVWEFIAECFTIDDILEDLIREKINTLEEAIEYYNY